MEANDCVVIGGGAAGLTIVAQHSGDSNVSVAMREAGGFYRQEKGIGESSSEQ